MRVVMESVEVAMNARRYQMSDRYLFKAKRRNWKEFPKEQWWVEGYYCKRKTGHYTDTGYQEEYRDCIIAEFSDGGINWCDIDPPTICRCTGLKDKNGKLIWENDIVSVIREDGFIEYAIIDYYISSMMSGFRMKPIKDWMCTSFDEVEVIGNIFDNPELLEVEE